jgi:dipeptidyl aminopeptidase/acylaminoacyl peptidase
MTDQDVRDFLERMATEESVQFLDAEPLTRRARRRAARTVIVGALGVAAALAVLFTGVASIRSTPVPADDPTPIPAPSEDLGVFAPVAGWIVYGNQDGIWGVDPAAPGALETRVQLSERGSIPLGWSSDGTRLLIMRISRGHNDGRRREFHLFVMHADGSETKVTKRPMGWSTGATISPDGSRVVFATYKALYGVDVAGGRPSVLLEAQGEVWAPTFSPDGTQVAYVDGSGDHSHSVWVMDADGGDAHQILANETTMGAGHVYGLAWSPAGDRIALGLGEATYTFTPDGSDFTQLITDGFLPYWSPDGSQLAYVPISEGEHGGIAIANADGSNARELDYATASGPWTSGPWHPAPRGAG